MAKRSNKWIAEMLTPSISSSLSPSPSTEATTYVNTSSQCSIRDDNIHDVTLDRKITIATEGFTTRKYCKLVLKNRSRLQRKTH